MKMRKKIAASTPPRYTPEAMAVSDSFLTFAVEQLSRVEPVRGRRMFGGVGLYAGDLFFALIADDTLYFKVDESNRADFERWGTGPFMPFGDEAHPMQYYEVPIAVLEEIERLEPAMRAALAVARRARAGRRRGGRKRR